MTPNRRAIRYDAAAASSRACTETDENDCDNQQIITLVPQRTCVSRDHDRHADDSEHDTASDCRDNPLVGSLG